MRPILVESFRDAGLLLAGYLCAVFAAGWGIDRMLPEPKEPVA